MTTPSPDGKPVRRFKDAAAFDKWLEANHAKSDGIWIEMAKKATGIRSVDWDTAVPVALCHGWIDSQRRGGHDGWFLQKFTPRRPRSNWSQVNCEHVERLIAEGKMRPWGLAEVDKAKSDGRWDKAYRLSSCELPAELEAALKKSKKARAEFDKLDSQNRYAMIYRVGSPKRAETRERHAARFVEMLERGERLY